MDVYAFARMLAKIAHGFVVSAGFGDIELELPSANSPTENRSDGGSAERLM
jgi:hypothetical protein